MSPPDPRTAELVALERRTAEVLPPARLRGKVMAALIARERARAAAERRTVVRAIGLALTFAACAVGLAAWADHRLDEELTTSSGRIDWEAP